MLPVESSLGPALLATLQFLYDGNCQDFFPTSWVVIQLKSTLYVTVVRVDNVSELRLKQSYKCYMLKKLAG